MLLERRTKASNRQVSRKQLWKIAGLHVMRVQLKEQLFQLCRVIAIFKMLCCFQFVWGIKMDILLGRIISWKLHSHPPSWRRDPVTFKKLLVLKSISLCNILPYYLKNVLLFTLVIFSKTATKVLKILRWYLAISSPPWLNSFHIA